MRKPMPFGKYLLLDRIAVGGMAEVFGAKAFGVEGFERIVAIKRILPNMVEDDEFIAMFIDEARIAALLNHASIATIYELGRHDETYFIAMEYVSGRDVRLLIDKFKKRGQTVPFAMAAFILAKMAEGLDYAHARKDQNGNPLGIVHRDISPQNVLVSYDGDVKIIDFGIAKVSSRHQKTEAGILKGKFAYMSPEQVRGQAIDHRADLYAAGVMLYEMVTGTKLFSGESDFSTLEKVRAGTVRPPSEVNFRIPAELEKIVLKALAEDREQRYQTGAEFHDDLMRFVFSEKDVFSGKNLASFMKEAFAEEFRKEQDRIRRWQETSADDTPDFEPTRFSKTTTGPKNKVRIGEPAPTDSLKADEPTPIPETSKAVAAMNAKPPPPLPEGEASETDGSTRVTKREEIVQSESTRVGPVKPEAKPETAAKPADEKKPETEAKSEKTPSPKAPPLAPPKSKLPLVATLALLVIAGVAAVGYMQLNKAPPTVVITVRKPPKNVQIFVDGTKEADGASATVQSTPGNHTLEVKAPGFKTHEESFALTNGQKAIDVTLDREPERQPEPEQTPPPVADALDGGTPENVVVKGPGTSKTKLDGGHSPTVKNPGTPDAGVSGPQFVDMTEKPDAGSLPINPPKTASLSIVSTPPGAMVTVNGAVPKGPNGRLTPLTALNLPVGQPVKVKFVLKGYEAKEATYVLTGQGDKLEVALDAVIVAPPKGPQEPSPPPTPPVVSDKATLKVTCFPNSKVFIDDKKVGSASATGVDFLTTPGAHRVVCETELGAKSSKDVTVAAGESQPVRIRVQ